LISSQDHFLFFAAAFDLFAGPWALSFPEAACFDEEVLGFFRFILDFLGFPDSLLDSRPVTNLMIATLRIDKR